MKHVCAETYLLLVYFSENANLIRNRTRLSAQATLGSEQVTDGAVSLAIERGGGKVHLDPQLLRPVLTRAVTDIQT